jgi:hypothetical protein
MWACAATGDVSSNVPLAVFAGSFAYLTISKRTAEEFFLLLVLGFPQFLRLQVVYVHKRSGSRRKGGGGGVDST